jgi:hypothetical protein
MIVLQDMAMEVQVRQHVDHKRTFMFLEQLILKHNAHEQCINIKEIHQGIDFFFANRAHGQKFVDFLQVRPWSNVFPPVPAGIEKVFASFLFTLSLQPVLAMLQPWHSRRKLTVCRVLVIL